MIPRLNDTNKTWRGVTTAQRNFGHQAVAIPGTKASTTVVFDAASNSLLWADRQTRISPDQWANMGADQRQALLAKVPAARRQAVTTALAGGVVWRASEKAPQQRTRLSLNTGREGDFQHRLRRYAKQATDANLNQLGACYNTANQTAKLNGGRDLDGARDFTGARGQALGYLSTSVENGTLKAGMSVYMNLDPGNNPRSLNDGSRPHWMTYMGKDPDGTLRFADQFRTDWTLPELVSAYGPRRIDLYVDPYARCR